VLGRWQRPCAVRAAAPPFEVKRPRPIPVPHLYYPKHFPSAISNQRIKWQTLLVLPPVPSVSLLLPQPVLIASSTSHFGQDSKQIG
jgi:hypothetical protein